MSNYKIIFQALENSRLYSQENNIGLLLEATKRAQRLAQIEIGPINMDHPEGVNRALLEAMFPDDPTQVL